MNIENRREMLKAYIETNVAPILIKDIEISSIPDAVMIPANIDNTLLQGHYVVDKFVPPKWYEELATKTAKYKYLVIRDIDSISKDDQLKFVELLKYRKIGEFKLDENCVIIITAKEINGDVIASDIYALVAHI